ncbi:hypothetical protein ACFLW9_02590 [Chloroflexota bacterium]
MPNSQELYITLLKEAAGIQEFMKRTPQYHSFLEFSDFNMRCEKKMFEQGLKQRLEYFQMIPDLEKECKQCWRFYLNPRNKSIKKYDVIYGKKFEEVFIKFLNNIGIDSAKADEKNAVLPDNLIRNIEGKTIAYYEVKYHNAPFVKAYQYQPGRECYEGSITIDYEKVQKQIETTKAITDLPVYYVHWVDFPCIKGIYYMSLEETQKAMESGIAYSRKAREGDYITNNKKVKQVGYQNKFYPSLLTMNKLEQFVLMFQ